MHQPEDKAFANKLTGMDMKQLISMRTLSGKGLAELCALSTSEEVEKWAWPEFLRRINDPETIRS